MGRAETPTTARITKMFKEPKCPASADTGSQDDPSRKRRRTEEGSSSSTRRLPLRAHLFSFLIQRCPVAAAHSFIEIAFL